MMKINYKKNDYKSTKKVAPSCHFVDGKCSYNTRTAVSAISKKVKIKVSDL